MGKFPYINAIFARIFDEGPGKNAAVDRRQLRYFQQAARLEHLGRAAERLEISESTLSRSIAQLEKSYGSTLFDHVGRGVTLNRRGKILLTHVDRALRELDYAERMIRDGDRHTITLGFVPSLGGLVIPDIVTGFKLAQPDIELRLVQDSRARLLEALFNGEIDLCIAAHRFPEPSLCWESLWEEHFVVIVPAGHRLAARRVIDIRELENEPMVAFKPGHILRETLDEMTRTAGFVPTIVFQGDDASMLFGLVGVGLGIALLPQSIGSMPGKVAVLRLRTPRTRTIGFSWVSSSYDSPLAVAFRTFVASTVARRYDRRSRAPRSGRSTATRAAL